jgi:hypothetical protein
VVSRGKCTADRRALGPCRHTLCSGRGRPRALARLPPHDVEEGAALDAEDGGALFLRIHGQTRREGALVRGRQGSGWRPMRVPYGALTGLIGVLLGASAISVLFASGRCQQNVSSGTPPEPGDAHDETPTYQRGTGRCTNTRPVPVSIPHPGRLWAEGGGGLVEAVVQHPGVQRLGQMLQHRLQPGGRRDHAGQLPPCTP